MSKARESKRCFFSTHAAPARECQVLVRIGAVAAVKRFEIEEAEEAAALAASQPQPRPSPPRAGASSGAIELTRVLYTTDAPHRAWPRARRAARRHAACPSHAQAHRSRRVLHLCFHWLADGRLQRRVQRLLTPSPRHEAHEAATGCRAAQLHVELRLALLRRGASAGLDVQRAREIRPRREEAQMFTLSPRTRDHVDDCYYDPDD